MNYLEFDCKVTPDTYNEVVMAVLSDAGFESFSETPGGFMAYIREEDYNEELFKALPVHRNRLYSFEYRVDSIPQQNWNEIWESNFDPVMIPGKCIIRASFHRASHDYPMEVIIDPKMSFGTGHHETTTLLASWLFDIPVKDRRVLDMGCGTGILAIIAKKLGAGTVVAVDNDPWSCENSAENIIKNGTPDIRIIEGDRPPDGLPPFDIILANINRNILLSGMEKLAGALAPGGCLFMSGFYLDDLPEITKSASQFGMVFQRSVTLNNWCASMHIKSQNNH